MPHKFLVIWINGDFLGRVRGLGSEIWEICKKMMFLKQFSLLLSVGSIRA